MQESHGKRRKGASSKQRVRRIHSVEQAVRQPKKFRKRGDLPHAALHARIVEKVQADVDFFIATLKETAKVYETAYRTAELSMNISNAIDNIQELNALGDLTNDIMESWKNLDSILDNLTDISNLVG